MIHRAEQGARLPIPMHAADFLQLAALLLAAAVAAAIGGTIRALTPTALPAPAGGAREPLPVLPAALPAPRHQQRPRRRVRGGAARLGLEDRAAIVRDLENPRGAPAGDWTTAIKAAGLKKT